MGVDRYWTETAPIFARVVGCRSVQGRERRFRRSERNLIPLVPETLVHYPLGEKFGLGAQTSFNEAAA